LKIEEVYAYIHSRLKFGMRPGLLRIQALLKAVDNPEKKLSVIHIAGTNGKGSTVAFLRTILLQHALKVATFTSPYVDSFNERISINEEPISDEKLIKYLEYYQPIVAVLDEDELLENLTEFELITSIACSYFADENVDVAIFEVGLGGLYDSTNVLDPDLVGITTIGYDHQEILGETLPEIAAQKAGIIKKKVPVVTGKIGDEEAFSVIEKKACEFRAPLFQSGKDYETVLLSDQGEFSERFDYLSEQGKFSDLKISLFGHHQVENAAMAIKMAQIYLELNGRKLDEGKLRDAMLATFWPARMERVCQEPLIILDGAHNPHAMNCLVENLQQKFACQKIKILFSALTTKNVREMVAQLAVAPNAKLYLTTFDDPKALILADVSDLADENDENIELVANWQLWIEEVSSKMSREDVLLVTGSLYFASQVRTFLSSFL